MHRRQKPDRAVAPDKHLQPKLDSATTGQGTLINDVACSVVAGFVPLMQQRSLRMSFDPAVGDPRVDADQYLLERILFNLLLHAVTLCEVGIAATGGAGQLLERRCPVAGGTSPGTYCSMRRPCGLRSDVDTWAGGNKPTAGVPLEIHLGDTMQRSSW